MVAENKVASGVKVAVVTDFTLRLCVLIKAKRPSSANYPALSVFREHWENDRGARGRMWLVSKGRGLLNWVMQPMVSLRQSYTASSGQRSLLNIHSFIQYSV